MQETSGDVRNVLAYLRQMVQYCQEQRRQDLEWEYQQAVDFLSARIFGQLPPRKKIVAPGYSFHQPANPKLPPGFRPAKLEMPLRSILQLDYRPHGYGQVAWETLECKHELMAPPGHYNPVSRRRCIYCAFEKAQSASVPKKPSSSVAPCNGAIAKVKVVGA